MFQRFDIDEGIPHRLVPVDDGRWIKHAEAMQVLADRDQRIKELEETIKNHQERMMEKDTRVE